jgi:hypothetical protein
MSAGLDRDNISLHDMLYDMQLRARRSYFRLEDQPDARENRHCEKRPLCLPLSRSSRLACVLSVCLELLITHDPPR